GRAGNGNFCLTVFAANAEPLAGGKATALAFANPRATHQQDAGRLSVASSIRGHANAGWAVDRGGIGKSQAAAFDLAKPIEWAGGAKLTFALKFRCNTQHNIGRLRISVADKPGIVPSVEKDKAPKSARPDALIAVARTKGIDSLKPAERAALTAWFKTRDADWQVLDKALTDHVNTRPRGKKITVMVSSEGLKPRKNHADGRGYKHFHNATYYLKRGDAGQKQGVVKQDFLQALMRGGKDASYWQEPAPNGSRTSFRRKAMANWIMDVDHGAGHLAARVIVNRLWQHHFGRGIVATSSDFGQQGDPPSHPELLDWLASELIRNGWRLKPIHKLMMTTAAYQQSSKIDAAKEKVDPENFLLWRYSPWRLEAEAVRDSLLAITGELDKTMYGPGTLNAGSNRRSIYFTIKRSKLVTMMMLFDVPEPLVSQGRRATTTIAPQALLLMNSPHVRRYAETFSRQIAANAKTPAEQIRVAFSAALQRAPDDAELASLTEFLKEQQKSYGAAGNAAQLALADLCQAVLSLNEVIYVE
ncbi:MAG: DUF1553 domain-containing protein, partial [Pirellulales bacterium]|nr:DUF1553 domain-containing protein [Pirellulales bacterium]